MIGLVILQVALIALNPIFAGTEISVLSVNEARLGQLEEEGNKRAKKLKRLMQNPGQVFSPREIYSKIWNDLPLGSENTVAVHIRHLREKMNGPTGKSDFIKTVWGVGYKVEE